MGLTAEVERVTAGATQPPPQRAKGVLESSEGRPVPADTGAVPLPPPPLSRTRDAVWKLLLPRLSRKRQAEAPTLVPLKVLKVSTSSTARWVVDAQAAMQCGAASARANPKELVTQGEATKAATKKAGEEVPTPWEAGATEGEAEAPRTFEAKVVEAGASRASEVEVVDAGAPRTTEAEVAEAGAPGTTKAKVVEARAPRTTEAEVVEAGLGTAEPAAQDAETESGQASEVADAEAASTAEQPTLTSGEGSSALVREALHTGVKRALAVVSSHYAGINLEAVSDGYIMAEDDEKAEEEVMKLVEVAESPSTTLARLFEEEVVPPTPTADAGDPEF
ncbi:uncharacterized protein [Miscanthus floridulus]|uniref:uncharacterized protein n=1 Tax=Miscanthus floridulus TaxID=154761 RepID=UPI00345A16B8